MRLMRTKAEHKDTPEWLEMFFTKLRVVRRVKLRRLYAEQDGKCCYCGCNTKLEGDGRRRATLEHIVPQFHGGTDAMWNLMMACQECNSKRGSRLDAMTFFMLRCDPEAWELRKAAAREKQERDVARKAARAERHPEVVYKLAVVLHLFPDFNTQVNEALGELEAA